MARRVTVREVETPVGRARATITTGPVGGRGLVVLGHGAGGGIETADLLAVTGALVASGWTVARVEQPYRVKGRRAPDAAPRLDLAWTTVVAALRRRRRGLLVVAGRSSGARVACRSAGTVGADAVVALAFPLHPPGRPEKSRADELFDLAVPTLIVQGERDAFGTPEQVRTAAPGSVTVVGVPGDHALKQAPDRVAAAVLDWCAGIGPRPGALHPA
ncbi:MAG TPA: alpha/beta family hydrolase [Mycobacteriales bacterium]|nr:alpha/beta family hydrolase [Mycobacteriales bacterium]